MPLSRYVGKRLLWMVPSLLGITLVTFLVMDLAPASRAELAVNAEELSADDAQRQKRVDALRRHWGMVDPETGEPYSVWTRYGQWLGRAATLDLAGPGENPARFRDRIMRALPITLLINALALLLALAIAIPLGARLGMSAGSAFDRSASSGLLLLYGVPEFLLATLLLVALGGGLMEAVLPSHGLRSPDAGQLSTWGQIWDMVQHLVMPVIVMTIGPCVIVTRFLRESVARAARSDFVLAMRGWGLPERVVRRRALHNGLSPLVTLLGTMLPALVSGSVVVENVFSLPGLGKLTFDAVLDQDYSMVMAMTLLVAIVTLVSLIVSDVLHRVVDPRVELR